MANIMRVGGGGGGSKVKTKPLSTVANGSTVSVLEDGKLTQFYVAKHDYEAELNGSGRTLLVRKEIHSTRAWDTAKSRNYEGSSIDIWLNGDFKEKLSSLVKVAMGGTFFPSANASLSVGNVFRSVFLLSIAELGFSNTGGTVEGTALPIASALKIALSNGAATTQYTRSPHINAGVFWVMENGTLEATDSDYQRGIRPCFTLPSDMALRAEPLADGSWALADEEFLLDTKTAKTTPKSGVSYTNGIADLDAATLHEIGKAISSNPKITNETSVVYYDSGDVHRKISIGDTYNVDYHDYIWEVDNKPLPVNILGFNHDDLAFSTAYGEPTATGKAGISFQMVNSFSSKRRMEATAVNANGWTACEMRAAIMPEGFKGFGALKDVIKGVRKFTSAGNKSANIIVTEDTLFLLSEIEIFGSTTNSFDGEGTQYAYYKAGNSKVKNVGSSAYYWWERSPYKGNYAEFGLVGLNGSSTSASANGDYGLAFAYCI